MIIYIIIYIIIILSLPINASFLTIRCKVTNKFWNRQILTWQSYQDPHTKLQIRKKWDYIQVTDDKWQMTVIGKSVLTISYYYIYYNIYNNTFFLLQFQKTVICHLSQKYRLDHTWNKDTMSELCKPRVSKFESRSLKTWNLKHRFARFIRQNCINIPFA